MKCENNFCVYNKKGNCIIEPSMNVFGACESCVYVEPDPDYIDALKIKLLKSWGEEDIWKKYVIEE